MAQPAKCEFYLILMIASKAMEKTKTIQPSIRYIADNNNNKQKLNKGTKKQWLKFDPTTNNDRQRESHQIIYSISNCLKGKW